jgi:predicted GNAT family N-acyltransferase
VTGSIEVRLARTKEDFEAILEIRRLVFREEQGLAQNSLVDPDDIASIHAMAIESGRVVSAGRLTPPNARRPEAGIAWVATRRQDRGRGFGGMVMRALLDAADERGFPVVTLTAQVHAIGFYEDLGFVAYGKRFDLGGVEHQQMERRQDAQRAGFDRPPRRRLDPL